MLILAYLPHPSIVQGARVQPEGWHQGTVAGSGCCGWMRGYAGGWLVVSQINQLVVSTTAIAASDGVIDSLGCYGISSLGEELDCENSAGFKQSIPTFAGYPLCLTSPSTTRFRVPGI